MTNGTRATDAGSGRARTTPDGPEPPRGSGTAWLTPGVRGIGLASLLSDLGHEIPTSLLPAFLTVTLGAPAAALGLIEGIADALSGAAKFVGGALADDPGRRRTVAVGGYTITAILSSLVGLATSAWQVGLLRAGAWTARGVRGPSRNALLADSVDAAAYGRAFGFERAMDNLGAVGGPLLALGLVAIVGVREAILLSVIPGLLAALAIVYAVRHLPRQTPRSRPPIRIRIRPVLVGRLRRLFLGIGLFEFGNLAATLLILRASELLAPDHGVDGAGQIAIFLYVAYNVAGTLSSVPAGHLADRIGMRPVLAMGAFIFACAYGLFALSGADIPVLAVAFVLAGVGIGCVETAEHAVVAGEAPADLRGSAFGLLAAVQSMGDFAASALGGLLWTVAGPAVAFTTVAALAAAGGLVVASSGGGRPAAPERV